MQLWQQCLQSLPELALAVATEGSAALLWGLEALGAGAGADVGTGMGAGVAQAWVWVWVWVNTMKT